MNTLLHHVAIWFGAMHLGFDLFSFSFSISGTKDDQTKILSTENRRDSFSLQVLVSQKIDTACDNEVCFFFLKKERTIKKPLLKRCLFENVCIFIYSYIYIYIFMHGYLEKMDMNQAKSRFSHVQHQNKIKLYKFVNQHLSRSSFFFVLSFFRKKNTPHSHKLCQFPTTPMPIVGTSPFFFLRWKVFVFDRCRCVK